MSRNKKPTISVVIPVYNDAKYIKGCLDSIKNQTVKPFEVIVIDNNCTDKSIHIAKQYDFVHIVSESRQGLSFARSKGFEIAKGDVVLRIDADTILPPNYISNLGVIANTQHDVAGFTGYGISRYSFIPNLSIPWSWGYFTFSHGYLGYPMLWGANMAIRRDYWHKLKPYLINNDMAVHEDQDISLALVSIGGKIALFKDLTVSVDMSKLLDYKQYRKYGLMLHLLKILDAQHPRHSLPSRLPKTSIIKRSIYWFITVWGVYAFYFVTFIYAAWRKLTNVKI